MRSGFLCTLCLCLFLTAPLALQGQPAFLVKDINTTVSGGAGSPLSSEPVEVVDLQGVALFTVADGIHGIELWRSDGTAAGTRIVRDICPGSCSSSPSLLTVAGSHAFFRADDGAHGVELWKTDGTAAGTVLVKELTPGLSGSRISLIRSLDDTVFVLVYEPLLTRYQGWRSDGTAAGTVAVEDLRGIVGRLGDALFLAIEDPLHGTELWKTDGTDAGTVLVKDVRPGAPSSVPSRGTAAGGKLFFTIAGQSGAELWVTDGTEAGTTGLGPIAYNGPGPGDYFGEFTVLGSEVLFPAWDSAHGQELWKSDGTPEGTRLLKDILPGTHHSSPHAFASAGGKVFFVAYDGTHGFEMWGSDGTEAGTVLVEDIYPGDASGLEPFQPRIRVDVSGRLVFWADDGTHGYEPWASDGTAAGTSLLADIVAGTDSSYYSYEMIEPPGYITVADRFAAVGGRMYFRPFLGSEEPEIWTTDGTAAGTGPLLEIDTQTSSLRQGRQGDRSATDLNGVLVFSADDGMTGAEPWRSDGTEAGTFLLQDISGPFASPPNGFIRLGNDAIFVVRPYGWLWKTDGVAGGEDLGLYDPLMSEPTPMGAAVFVGTGSGLFRSDGTAAGTLRVGPEGPTKNPTRAGDSLLFYTRKNTALEVDELWKVETAFNTSAVRDVASGGPVNPDQLTMAGGLLFFSAGQGSELWRSDGTAAGTMLLKKAGPGETFQIPRIYGSLFFFPKDVFRALAPAGSLLLFVAGDGASGYELWKSDGTAAGTGLLKDIFPGPQGSEPSELTAVGNLVYFVADEGVHGRELWVSDGTAAGTRLVEDVNPGPGSSTPQQLRHLRHTLLFAADDGTHGLEPWVSDGTVATTSLLEDIAPDAWASSPRDFAVSGPLLYFGANDGTHGVEPWALPKTAVGSTFADVTRAHWAWSQVEAIAAAGITLGCAPERYCAGVTVTRPEMAVFLGRALHGGGFTPPPATGTRFEDVPANHWAGAWIEQIAADGVTQGCSANPPLFCVGSKVTRAEMAIFLLRAKHGGSYTPPPATGTVFTDVPANHWAGAWIEQLAAEGITNGCAAGRYCPGSVVGRAEMAVFLTRTFGLTTP